MKLHNVHDRRYGWVGSWEVEPLNYAALTEADIGRTVIYSSKGLAWDHEAGTITSFRDGLVFARFSRGSTSAACKPSMLSLAVKALDGEEGR